MLHFILAVVIFAIVIALIIRGKNTFSKKEEQDYINEMKRDHKL